MTFRKSVSQTPSVSTAYRDGLGALRETDRSKISIEDTRLLKGSIDLDSALKREEPASNRWDYGIAWKRNQNSPEQIAWVEVHPLRSGKNLKEIEQKWIWLRGWLNGNGHRLDKFPREFICIASGKMQFSKTAPQLRRLAQQGIRMPGRHVSLR
jgi:hypothetical protein